MFSQEETVKATRVYVQFLNWFSIEYVILKPVCPCNSPSIIETIKWRLPYNVAIRSEDPNVSVLHLSKLDLVFVDNYVFSNKPEDFFDITLVGSKAIHVKQGVRLFV